MTVTLCDFIDNQLVIKNGKKMIKIVQVQVGKRTVTAYEYTKLAFSTSKGTFTLIGSNTNGIDTFKCLETGEWHEWSRVQLYEWLKQGKIIPVQ